MIPGVAVGHCTVSRDPDVRTGVTVIVPRDLPLHAGFHVLNGNGEMTGLLWVRESGLLTTPVGLTNTFSVGVVRDAIVAAVDPELWALPVVAETYDGFLNDIAGMHVTREHVFAALDDAREGDVVQGCVGGGTGMICHGFKGGIGIASRPAGAFAVGVLVQANHGRRPRLTIDGVPVGRELGPDVVPSPGTPDGAGSIIVVVATDAPLLPHQCDRLAQRAVLGIGRTGGAGENSSGDIVLCFSIAEPSGAHLPNEELDELFYATIEATEAAILSALLHATTTSGRDGRIVHALPHDLFTAVMRRHGRDV
jgi:D-aminopeptidase